jgi:membrane-bound serine protease (ClpP class)
VEITDPTLAYLLVILGLTGIGIEAVTPGGFIPAILGLLALIFGVIGMVDIGPTAIGLGLLLLAIALFIAAVALHLYRPLSIAGVVSLAASGIWMFDRDSDPTSIVAVTIGAVVLGLFMLFVIERASVTRAAPIRYGPEDLAGMSGDVRVALRPDGQVFVDGGLWQARLVDPEGRLGIGEKITVLEVEGLTLVVAPQSDPNQGEK